MNKEFTYILADLQLDGIEQTQNTVVLSVEQMTALDNHLSALAEEKQTLTNEIASLREQVSNLQKADGDETSHIEDGAVVDMSHLSRAKADYERMKHLN